MYEVTGKVEGLEEKLKEFFYMTGALSNSFVDSTLKNNELFKAIDVKLGAFSEELKKVAEEWGKFSSSTLIDFNLKLTRLEAAFGNIGSELSKITGQLTEIVSATSALQVDLEGDLGDLSYQIEKELAELETDISKLKELAPISVFIEKQPDAAMVGEQVEIEWRIEGWPEKVEVCVGDVFVINFSVDVNSTKATVAMPYNGKIYVRVFDNTGDVDPADYAVAVIRVIPPLPVIEEFSISSGPYYVGDEVQLNWKISNFTTGKINEQPIIPGADGANYILDVWETMYVLTANHELGAVSKAIQIEVLPKPEPPPEPVVVPDFAIEFVETPTIKNVKGEVTNTFESEDVIHVSAKIKNVGKLELSEATIKPAWNITMRLGLSGSAEGKEFGMGYTDKILFGQGFKILPGETKTIGGKLRCPKVYVEPYNPSIFFYFWDEAKKIGIGNLGHYIDLTISPRAESPWPPVWPVGNSIGTEHLRLVNKFAYPIDPVGGPPSGWSQCYMTMFTTTEMLTWMGTGSGAKLTCLDLATPGRYVRHWDILSQIPGKTSETRVGPLYFDRATNELWVTTRSSYQTDTKTFAGLSLFIYDPLATTFTYKQQWGMATGVQDGVVGVPESWGIGRFALAGGGHWSGWFAGQSAGPMFAKFNREAGTSERLLYYQPKQDDVNLGNPLPRNNRYWLNGGYSKQVDKDSGWFQWNDNVGQCAIVERGSKKGIFYGMMLGEGRISYDFGASAYQTRSATSYQLVSYDPEYILGNAGIKVPTGYLEVARGPGGVAFDDVGVCWDPFRERLYVSVWQGNKTTKGMSPMVYVYEVVV